MTTTKNQTQVIKDLKEKSILVSREFDAPIEHVWRAFTESELLEKWWAPEPWRAETKSMSFTVGGYWLYAMVGPENEKHWARMDYISIDYLKSFGIKDSFCDEEGNINQALPVSTGLTSFTKTTNGTLVEFKMNYATETDIHKLVEMGFEEGITMTFEHLATLFSQGKI